MIVSMTRVEVVGSKRKLPEVLNQLQDAGVVHVSHAPLEDAEGVQILESPSESPTTPNTISDSNLLERTGELLREMSKNTPREVLEDAANQKSSGRLRDEFNSLPTEEIDGQIKAVHPGYSDRTAKFNSLQSELSLITRYAPAFEALSELLADTDGSMESTGSDLSRRAVILDSGAQEVLAGLADIVDIITDETGEVYKATIKGGQQAVLLIYPDGYDDQIGRMLGDEGLEELQVPVAFRKMSLAEASRAFQDRLTALPSEIESTQEDLNSYLSENSARIEGLLQQVMGRLDSARQTDKIGFSDRAFLLHGYVPATDFGKLKEGLDGEFQGSVAITDLGIEHGEEGKVPTKLKNRGFIKDFEVLLSLLPPARYGTIDATPFIAIGFPFFFGLMLGDIMYAFFVLGLGYLLRVTLGKRIEMIRAGSTVLLACGLSTLFFGFFFGEFGGDIQIGLHYWIYDRHHDMGTALAVVLCIGFVHIQIGLLLNALKHFRHNHIQHVIGSIGYMFSLVGLLLVAINFLGAAGKEIMGPAYLLLTVGVLGILIGEKFKPVDCVLGILHILSYAGNIFSYARLMAIGMASVMLAVVANDFMREAPIYIGLFAALFFHALNFVLGIFGPSIHSLRLHYVEFFGKFYEPEGTVYQPFRKFGG